MRRVAFYAPMKPPTHPVPSGDREMARNLMTIIAHGPAQVDLVSTLQAHDSKGDAATQAALRTAAQAEIDRLLADETVRNADLWVTYHSYYKSPDLIGPEVCRRLGLPYVQIEATRAKRRLSGPWAGFAAAAEAACDAASVIFYLTALDLITLEREKTPDQTLVHLRPFLPVDDLPPAANPGDADPAMLAVGMMRARAKLESYAILAQALTHLDDLDWTLDIAGDGPERAQVETLMAPFGPRVRFLGQLDRTGLAAAYARAGLYVWPGVNEAFGMAYLEAQAAGLPVVAQDRPGVCDVLPPGRYPAPEDGPRALSTEMRALLTDPSLRAQRGARARARIAQLHLMPAATKTFWTAVRPLLEQHR